MTLEEIEVLEHRADYYEKLSKKYKDEIIKLKLEIGTHLYNLELETEYSDDVRKDMHKLEKYCKKLEKAIDKLVKQVSKNKCPKNSLECDEWRRGKADCETCWKEWAMKDE